MKYFRFSIPRNKDGTIATYSPGWFGEMTWPPKNEEVEVLLYNDKEGYGYARTESEAITGCATRGECQLVDEAEALGVVTEAALKGNLPQVYFGAAIEERWKPEPVEAKPLTAEEIEKLMGEVFNG